MKADSGNQPSLDPPTQQAGIARGVEAATAFLLCGPRCHAIAELVVNTLRMGDAEYQLVLRRAALNDRHDDFAVVWETERWGPRRIGRIRLATESSEGMWLWYINPPLPVPPWGSGQAIMLDDAKAQIKDAWARFVEMQAAEGWVTRLGPG